MFTDRDWPFLLFAAVVLVIAAAMLGASCGLLVSAFVEV